MSIGLRTRQQAGLTSCVSICPTQPRKTFLSRRAHLAQANTRSPFPPHRGLWQRPHSNASWTRYFPLKLLQTRQGGTWKMCRSAIPASAHDLSCLRIKYRFEFLFALLSSLPAFFTFPFFNSFSFSFTIFTWLFLVFYKQL